MEFRLAFTNHELPTANLHLRMNKPFIHPIRVYWEDTDAGGVVYHAQYLAFLERARSEWMRALGNGQELLREVHGLVFAVRAMRIDFRAPARLDDDLIVRSRVTQLSPARCAIAQSVWRDAAELTQGSVTVAFLDPSGRPQRQPAAWVERFSSVLKEQAPA